MQSILEKAYQTLAAGENMTSSYKGMGNQGVPDLGAMKDFNSPLSFQHNFQDLNLYGTEQLDHHLQSNMERPNNSLEGFMANNTNICVGKKRPNPYSDSGKSPLIWPDDLRLQDLGSAASCLGPQDDPFKGDQIHIAPPGIDRGPDLDSISDIYESKPVLSGDAVGEKKLEASANKLERPSPKRSALSADMLNPRSSPFG